MSTTMSRKGAEFWWNLKSETKFIVPKNVCYYEKDNPYDKWRQITWKEVFLKRKEKNVQNINRKLIIDCERIVPCYIWVFHNEQSCLFGGWYIYIMTLKNDYALNFRTSRKGKYTELIEKVKYMCPVEVLTFDFEDWAKEFSKKYPKKSKKRNEEGAVLCWCKINERGDIIDIYKKNDKPQGFFYNCR